jgi:VCBS repeat protein
MRMGSGYRTFVSSWAALAWAAAMQGASPVPSFNSPRIFQASGGVAAAADFNGDGNLDLVAMYSSGLPGSVSILLGDGRGGFRTGPSYTVGSEPRGVTVGDFN